MISFKLSPLRTVCPPRVKEKDCLPTPMGTWKELAPAFALNILVVLPDVTVTVPADVRSATMKTESDIVL